MNIQYRKLLSRESILAALFIIFLSNHLHAKTAIINDQSRHLISLNGKWNVMVDQGDVGSWKKFWIEPKPQKKTDFFEYSFDGGQELNVPGDFNSQMCELSFYEGTVWYRKLFNVSPKKDTRLFLYFGAVNYIADVYLNGEKRSEEHTSELQSR